jgi:hypothetical protein
MIQKNKFIYLRYIIKQTNTQYLSPIKPEQPVRPNLSPSDPLFQQAFAEFGQANFQYQQDLIKYKEDKKNQNKVVNNNKITDNVEDISQEVKLYATSIKFGINMGTGNILGISQADLVNWYMKPITINISGTSIVSSNLMLDSDNIIINMYNKFKKYLSENTFNYYQKPQFALYIENGLPGLNDFVGVIKDFAFDETADFPDKFNYSMSFEGKPSDQNVTRKASEAVQNDLNSINTSKIFSATQTAMDVLNNIKI